jgi:hypothetical protein
VGSKLGRALERTQQQCTGCRFFESIDEAAEMGMLTPKDKVHLAKLKLKGTARSFYTAQSELRDDDVTYAVFRTAFMKF